MNRIPTTQGIALAAEMLHKGYFASVAGKDQTVISNGIHHTKYNGKPYWFTESNRKDFQQAIRKIGSELILVQLVDAPNTPEEDPWCGGKDWVEKFMTLRQRISILYLFERRLGKKRSWYYNRLVGHTKVYNKIKPEELADINSALHQMALDLCSIELLPEEHD